VRLDELQKRTNTVEVAAFMASTTRTVEHLNTSIDRATILGVSMGYEQVRVFDMEEGRFISFPEFNAGRNVAVLGFDLAANLFPGTDPIGKNIKIFGRNIQVIGVIKKEGTGTFGDSQDEYVILPVQFLNQFIDVNSDRFNPTIMAKAKPGISIEELTDDITGAMRAIRMLKPYADDNFALNETSLLTQGFDGLFQSSPWLDGSLAGFPFWLADSELPISCLSPFVNVQALSAYKRHWVPKTISYYGSFFSKR
jgi:putative ABC transport system permease protein